jgi:hypothetical protein
MRDVPRMAQTLAGWRAAHVRRCMALRVPCAQPTAP